MLRYSVFTIHSTHTFVFVYSRYFMFHVHLFSRFLWRSILGALIKIFFLNQHSAVDSKVRHIVDRSFCCPLLSSFIISNLFIFIAVAALYTLWYPQESRRINRCHEKTFHYSWSIHWIRTYFIDTLHEIYLRNGINNNFYSFASIQHFHSCLTRRYEKRNIAFKTI